MEHSPQKFDVTGSGLLPTIRRQRSIIAEEPMCAALLKWFRGCSGNYDTLPSEEELSSRPSPTPFNSPQTSGSGVEDKQQNFNNQAADMKLSESEEDQPESVEKHSLLRAATAPLPHSYSEMTRVKHHLRSSDLEPLDQRLCDILPLPLINQLRSKLPAVYRHRRLRVLYTLDKDGAGRHMFYSKACKAGPVILLIQTTKHEVLGSFVSKPLKKTPHAFVGDADTFVFRVVDHDNRIGLPMWGADNRDDTAFSDSDDEDEFYSHLELKVYPCANGAENRCFLHLDDKFISIGGGGKKQHALWIGENFKEGSTYSCDTFNSPPLINTLFMGFFQIQNLQVIGFDQNF